MHIQFTLSMPNVGSWNGQWSGRNNLYAVVRSFTGRLGNAKAQAMLAKKSFYYSFGDGWGASVRISEITGAEARKVRKASQGFCGYEWMIDSICDHGAIYTDHLHPKPADAAPWPPSLPPKLSPAAISAMPLAVPEDCPW